MKKKVIQTLGALFAFVLLLSCFTACQSDEKISKNEENNESNNSNIFDSLKNDENQETNQIKTLVEVSSTGQIPYDNFHYSDVHGLETTDSNLFPFKYSSKYGFADAEGNVIISEQYDDVRLFSEGKAFVEVNDESMIIDTSGNELYRIPKEYNKALYSHADNDFKNGKAICTYTSKDSSSYYINVLVINSDLSTSHSKIPTNAGLTYRIINTPEFAGIITYNAYVEYDTSGTRNDKIAYRLFDLSGNKIWETETLYENLSPKVAQFEYKRALAPTYSLGILESFKVENGYINVFDENFKWGLLDLSNGKLALDYKYDYVGTYSDGLCNVCSYGKWGYVDLSGNQAFDFNYKYTEKFVNGKALVILEDDSFVVIDKSGAVDFDCGVSFNRPSGTQCKYQIHTDLQEKGIIVIWNYYGDEYHLINIGDSTKTIDEGFHPVIASENNIFVDETMFEFA